MKLDEKSAEYFRRDVNAAIMKAMFGRERLSNGREYITITDPDTDSVLYGFFNKYHPPKPKKIEEDISQVVEPEIKPKPKPKKSSGNKLTYAKLYISEIRKYPKNKLSYEYAGMCMHLAAYIEWHDGSLAMGTGKRRKFMERKDISKVLGVSDSTTRRFISKLEELKLVSRDGEYYKMIGKLFGKGKELNIPVDIPKKGDSES